MESRHTIGSEHCPLIASRPELLVVSPCPDKRSSRDLVEIDIVEDLGRPFYLVAIGGVERNQSREGDGVLSGNFPDPELAGCGVVSKIDQDWRNGQWRRCLQSR